MKARWPGALRRRWLLYHLADPHFAFMYDAPPEGEWVTLDCETTGLDVRHDRIISIAAVRIVGNRLMTSQRLELLVRPERAMTAENMRVHRLREQDVALGIDAAQAMRRLMDFIGSRPLVGYYLEFDVAMLNREIWPLLGLRLPQPKIEVSAMYYDYRNRQLSAHLRGGTIDLRFATMMNDLGLPLRAAHDALDDAVMAGLAFVKLRSLL
ncbi:3'-5' exonuclease [Variovorax sp. JS1663]|uniref:3'-5' exonuclease n=1 Tax=Variovorax sp. JS1663 TaxID=1851577 RepID=UPI000B347797|nr:3'-5' exonuclease [Variovorax sp. JS1663]OUM02268.1 DNA polymerase III subunit epsilon [Variovorax sp. JS1663]